MDDLKIAAVCMRSVVGAVDENLDRMRQFVAQAAAEGTDIVCFPELSVTGYTLNRPQDVYRRGEESKEAVDRLIQMARGAGLVILAGLIEASGGGAPFIAHVAAGPEGLIGRYRKTHLSPHEKAVYRAGEKLKVFSCGLAAFGVELCYESHFPEISTVMALKGADVLFIPHASPRGGPEQKLKSWLRHLPGRAFDNGIFVAACNQVGQSEEGFSFPGAAVVLGPDGEVLASYTGDKEHVLFAELKSSALEEVRRHRMKYFLPQRSPGLYKKIVEDD